MFMIRGVVTKLWGFNFARKHDQCQILTIFETPDTPAVKHLDEPFLAHLQTCPMPIIGEKKVDQLRGSLGFLGSYSPVLYCIKANAVVFTAHFEAT